MFYTQFIGCIMAISLTVTLLYLWSNVGWLKMSPITTILGMTQDLCEV